MSIPTKVPVRRENLVRSHRPPTWPIITSFSDRLAVRCRRPRLYPKGICLVP